MSDLRVELLYTPDCPFWEQVRSDLHRVLSEGAIETPIQLVLVSSQEDAEFLEFAGSPTVRLNGRDVAPLPPGAAAAIGCRVYPQPGGGLSGRLPEDLLRDAVRAHRQGRLAAFQRDESAKVAAAALEAATDEGLHQAPSAPGMPEIADAGGDAGFPGQGNPAGRGQDR